MVTSSELPWINVDILEIPTVLITTEGGQTFRYGSAVKGSQSIESIASEVQEKQSRSAEETMFKSLPFILNGQLTPNIDRDNISNAAWPVLKVIKKGSDAPRLFFTWYNDEEGPVVLKLAIAKHKKQEELTNIMHGGGRRRKRDGHGR